MPNNGWRKQSKCIFDSEIRLEFRRISEFEISRVDCMFHVSHSMCHVCSNFFQVECSDSVEPFSLDADFDYDNVVLTPKFSQIDIKKMATLISQPS